MRLPRSLGLCFGALVALTAQWAAADVSVPTLSSRITDTTHTLQDTQRAELGAKLAALEQRKGAQVAVLVMPTTAPETIEQFSVRAFAQWKLGRKGVDDGVLLMVAKDDHRVHIEVGYGLEGAIPDVAAHRIIDEYLTPKFRAGDFYGGIDAATDALAKLIDGETLPPAYSAKSRRNDDAQILTIVALFLAASVGRALTFLPGVVRGLLIGLAVFGFSFYQGLAMPWPLLAGLAGGVLATMAGAGWLGSGSGWSSSGGSYSGSGGSSGGGFSGGGGSSGGGGASGSW